MKDVKLCNKITICEADRIFRQNCCVKSIRWFDKEVETYFTLDDKNKDSIDNSSELFNFVFPKREFYLMSAIYVLKTWLINNFEKNDVNYDEFAEFYRKDPKNVWKYGIFDELIEEFELDGIALGTAGEIAFFYTVKNRCYDIEVRGKVNKGFSRAYKRIRSASHKGLVASMQRDANSFPNLYKRIPNIELDNFIIQGNKLTMYIGQDSTVTIPACVTVIQQHAFIRNNKIKKVILHKNVLAIEKEAFKECGSLKSVVIPKDSALKYIGVQAFQDCTSLQSISIPEMTKVESSAFKSCTIRF